MQCNFVKFVTFLFVFFSNDFFFEVIHFRNFVIVYVILFFVRQKTNVTIIFFIFILKQSFELNVQILSGKKKLFLSKYNVKNRKQTTLAMIFVCKRHITIKKKFIHVVHKMTNSSGRRDK